MIYLKDKGFYRMYPFVKGFHTIDVVKTADEAAEAAIQFGRVTKILWCIDLNNLETTIPDFHNVSLRFQQFSNALINGKQIKECNLLIEQIKS